MPVHDWTRVEAGIFHAFHVSWIPELQRTLNNGLLPNGYYALAEQHTGRSIPDLLALHAGALPSESQDFPPDTGGTAVAIAPPKVRRRQTIDASAKMPRSIAIRHVSGHRLIALLEIVSPANKDRKSEIESFSDKVYDALDAGVHVVVVDLFPPGASNPQGIHGAILQRLEHSHNEYDLPPEEPLTLASYVAGPPVEAYIDHLAVGAPLPATPLFIRRDRYVNLPLESTYQQAYEGMPSVWRDVLDRRE